MPKEGITIPHKRVGERAEALHFAVKWCAAKANKISADDVAWLFTCARRPAFIEAQKKSLGAIAVSDGMSPAGRARRIARLLSNFPDEFPRLWQACRREAWRRIRKTSRLEKAREAVRLFRLHQSLSATPPDRKELTAWAKKFTTDQNRTEVMSEIDAVCAAKPYAPLRAKDIEQWLEQRYGGEWSSTVEDALAAERGHVSGKKKR